jgi:uncharacterized protein
MNLSAIHIDAIKNLSKKNGVERLYAFGFVLTDKFTLKSDVDFVVKFKAIDVAHYFDNYFDFKEKLSALLNREVDLLEEQTIKNPYLKQSIDRSKQLIYGRESKEVVI